MAEPVEAAPSEPDQKMEVDPSPVESTQPEEETQPESVPQPETVQESPIEQPPTQEPAVEESPIDDEPPIEEDSLPIAVDEVESVTPSTAVEVSEVVESEGVSAAADTTTTIVINDSEPVITSPPESNRDKDEPIELQSSPSDIDPQENTVTNSQAVVVEPDAIVDLESSNSGDDVAISDEVNDSQALNSLELEAINSDSSLGVAEIQDDQPSSGGEAAAAQESPLPTSTADITITADVASVAKTNDNSVHSSEQAQNAVESTNNQKPIEIPDNFRTTITGDEETIFIPIKSFLFEHLNLTEVTISSFSWQSDRGINHNHIGNTIGAERHNRVSRQIRINSL